MYVRACTRRARARLAGTWHFARLGGGKPSTTDGHLIAQGNTAEKAMAQVLGHPQRGQQGEPWDRVNGTGFVAARDGDYADAVGTKRFHDRLFVSESYGTVSKASADYLGKLRRDSPSSRRANAAPQRS